MPAAQDDSTFPEACATGDLATVRSLLADGVSPDGPKDASDFERPLTVAINSYQFETAEFLLKAGAQPRCVAAILYALLEDPRFEPWIDCILDDIQPEQSEHVQQALVSAVEAGNRAMSEKLLAKCPPPEEFAYRQSPLVAAIIRKRTDLALWLIERGFDHRSQGEHEPAPATAAVLADEAKVLAKLLEAGESPHRTVRGHQSVFTCIPSLFQRLRHVQSFPRNDKYEIFHQGGLLHVAAVAGSPACARVLLETGADPHAPDSEGRTPAMLAALGGEPARGILDLLPEPDLSRGPALADLFTRSLQQGDVAGVRRSIANGIDVSQPVTVAHSVAWTPLALAASRGDIEILQALLDAGAGGDQTDCGEEAKPRMAGLRSLYRNGGLDLFARMPSPIGRTPLGWTAFHGHVEAIGLLVDHGADVQATDALEMTPLHAAALGDRPRAVRRLVELGLDLHDEAFDGMTPLHVAAEVNALKSIDVLLECGADPTRRNKCGETPYLAAKELGKTGAYRRLEEHTPEPLREKKRRPEKKEPSLVGGRSECRKILQAARRKHGAAARKLTTTSFRSQLAKAARHDAFVSHAEAVRKRLKAKELGVWDDVPQLRWLEDVKISDARLLRYQAELLPRRVFIVRELFGRDEKHRLYLIPTDDMFAVFGAFGTNGINNGIDAPSLMAWLMDLHQRRPFRLVGVAHDGLEIRFDEPVAGPDELIAELLTVCPPEEDEPSTVKRLRSILRSKTPQPLLWWD